MIRRAARVLALTAPLAFLPAPGGGDTCVGGAHSNATRGKREKATG